MSDDKKKTYEGPLHLDMPFDEALERFAGVKPAEVQANVKKAKKRKPPGGKKEPPGDDPYKSENVISLKRQREKRRR